MRIDRVKLNMTLFVYLAWSDHSARAKEKSYSCINGELAIDY